MALTSQLLNNNIFDGIYIKNIGNFGAVNIPKLNYNPIKFNYNVGNIENNSKIYVGFLQGDMTKPILIPDKKYIESLVKTSDTPVSIDLSNYYTKEELQNILDKLPVYDDYDSLKNKPIINPLPVRSRTFAPISHSSSQTIAAEGQPIPVEHTDTFKPLYVPV